VIGNLKWQEEIDSRSFTWQEAKDYAASLGDGWRLPTIAELLTLVNFTRVRPACSVFADCPSAFFWSSSPGIDRPNAAWGVGFSYGYTSSYDVGNDYRVRLVRSVS
jgi:hypothetical protein